ncbi:MAG: hypothetical protein NWF04_08900 [Candidatus Bathyarchaeota archaeon]|nr:hypothetical protein [Candidatus Bathyarchaeota archaeon]
MAIQFKCGGEKLKRHVNRKSRQDRSFDLVDWFLAIDGCLA